MNPKEEFELNEKKEWGDWLELDKFFTFGVQGITGVFKSERNNEFVFKIPQHVNYLAEHEYDVMRNLNTIADYCPHFCRAYGLIDCKVNPFIKKGNAFKLDDNKFIMKKVLIMEHIRNSFKFRNLLKTASEVEVFSIIKQTLNALLIAQDKCNLTHYDLFANNIVLKRCDKDLVMLYVIDDNNQFCVPTYGYRPIIIDYGFGYSKNKERSTPQYLWQSLAHTHKGFSSYRFDEIADFKHFLITVSDDMVHMPHSGKRSKKFANIVKNLFKKLKIDWKRGWDKTCGKSACETVSAIFQNLIKIESELFSSYTDLCIEMIQTLIVLPLSSMPLDNVQENYDLFLNEFIKIEREVGSSFYSLYLLKIIVDLARTYRSDFNKNRVACIGFIQNQFFYEVDKVLKYCNFKTLDFEKMLKGLYGISKGIEAIYHTETKKQFSKKQERYDLMEIKTPIEMLAIIDINISEDYTFNENTNILVIDANKGCQSLLKLNSNQINTINSLENIARGGELYDIYTS